MTSFRSPWQHRPFVALIAALRFLSRPGSALETRFVEYLSRDNNRRVRRYLADNPARRVLLIMPRCVKKTGCHADVQNSMAVCLPCQQCPLGQVAALCEQFGLQALVAFRSHIAFDMARREQPDLIVASACHDRLIKALRSVPEIPALLAPLAGMDRMCVNATLDLVWLEEQLRAVAPAVDPVPRVASGP